MFKLRQFFIENYIVFMDKFNNITLYHVLQILLAFNHTNNIRFVLITNITVCLL